jgi:hypothetical protein
MISDSLLSMGGSVVNAVINATLALRSAMTRTTTDEGEDDHHRDTSESEGEAKRNCLRGITYSEFDNIVGPQLRFQYPPHMLSKETFEDVSSYVIVGVYLHL